MTKVSSLARVCPKGVRIADRNDAVVSDQPVALGKSRVARVGPLNPFPAHCTDRVTVRGAGNDEPGLCIDGEHAGVHFIASWLNSALDDFTVSVAGHEEVTAVDEELV